MRKPIKNLLFTALGLIALCMPLLSCETAPTEEMYQFGCLATLEPDTLRFNVIDKDTREDLFLSDNPAYNLEFLKLSRTNPVGSDLQEMSYYLSEDRSHIYTYVSSRGVKTNIIFLKIGEQPLDTISYSIKMETTQRRNCPYFILDQVTFNHEAPEKNAHDRVIPFYRKSK